MQVKPPYTLATPITPEHTSPAATQAVNLKRINFTELQSALGQKGQKALLGFDNSLRQLSSKSLINALYLNEGSPGTAPRIDISLNMENLKYSEQMDGSILDEPTLLLQHIHDLIGNHLGDIAREVDTHDKNHPQITIELATNV